MDNGETKEDFRGASMPERVTVSNNTFDGNRYGITGGDNLTATGNTISHSDVGLKNVDGQSTVTGTRFIDNDVNYVHSNVVGSASATSAARLALGDVLDGSDEPDMSAANASVGAGGSPATTIGLGTSGHVEQPLDATSPASP